MRAEVLTALAASLCLALILITALAAIWSGDPRWGQTSLLLLFLSVSIFFLISLWKALK